MSLPRTSCQGWRLSVLTELEAGGTSSQERTTLIYFFEQMAELCDPWSLFQPHTVRKQLFGKRLWFILTRGLIL